MHREKKHYISKIITVAINIYVIWIGIHLNKSNEDNFNLISKSYQRWT